MNEGQKVQTEMLAVGQEIGCLDKSGCVFCNAKHLELLELSLKFKPGAVKMTMF